MHIPLPGIAVTTHPKAGVEIKATPKLSKRAERGMISLEAAKVKQEEHIRKVEAFKSKEDLQATQSETAFMIVSCKSPKANSPSN